MLWHRAARLIRERRLPDARFWWAHRDRIWREIRPPQAGAWHVIHGDPPIVYVMPFGREIEALARRLRNRTAWLLVSNPWIPRDATQATALRQATDDLVARHPHLSIVYLCNDPDEAARLASAGLSAEFCHQNAFLDERVFRVLPDVQKTHDAIYIAQLVSYKRHHLARDISSLLVKTYLTEWCDAAYIQQTREVLNHAEWVYDLTNAQVCGVINRSRVGLCLSAQEGGMYASMEYALSGLPIVTTPSTGGRHVFFDSAHVMTVEPDPASVRAGVHEMIERRLDPNSIRAAALDRIDLHRQTFVGIVNRILISAGHGPVFNWESGFIHKMHTTQPFSRLQAALTSRQG